MANFWTKTFNFYRVIQLNWLAKIELRDLGLLVVNFIRKMLKESVVRQKCYKKLKQ